MKERVDPFIIQKLSEKSLFPWLLDTVMDWTIIAGVITIAVKYPNPLSFLMALLLVGNRQHALAILGHDGTHFTLSKNKKLNDLLTNLLNMWPVGLTVSGYRKLHFQHHKALGTNEDPELLHKRARAPQWDLPASWGRILRYTVCDFLGYSIPDYWIIITFSKPEKKTELVYVSLFHMAILGVLLILGLWLVATIWYISLITTFMMFFRLRLWIEHQGTEETNRLHLTKWQGALLSPHNGWYHWEHHNWASVPYHRLPLFRKLLDSDKSIIPIKDLLKSYHNTEHIPSGTSLRLK